ncbi:MAG: DUF6787 family protein [Chryseolinea sp.]
MQEQTWIDKLKQRWKLGNTLQVVLVLVVFACTGITVLLIKKPILTALGGTSGSSKNESVLYWILIFPVYNALLLAYGFIFGQFNFFWEFEKRTFTRIGNFFGRIFGGKHNS